MKKKQFYANIVMNDLYDTKVLDCVDLTQSNVIRSSVIFWSVFSFI